jgi:RNA polymerase sigma factor (sigma-70 family)
MPAPTDLELLQTYTRQGSHDAFAQIVHRHVDLVYSAALRLTRDPHQAEDVTQTVFLKLAMKAGRLGAGVILAGWLHNTTRFVAADLRKAQARRRHYEERAAEIRTMTANTSPKDDWHQIAPDLDDAIATLGEANRLAIILRYFKGYSVSETAAELGISDDAVKQRSARGLEQLRGFFEGRGVRTAAGALASAMAANAVGAAPPALASSASAAIAAAVPVTKVGTGVALLANIKLVGAVVILVVLMGATTVIVRGYLRADAPRPPALAVANPSKTAGGGAAQPPARPAGILIKGRVTTPEGKPLAGAEVTVAAVVPVSVYRLFNFGAPIAVTGPDGTFEFPEQPPKSTVLIRSLQGYALTTAGQLASSPDVAVNAWGRIEGVLRAGDKPLANEVVGINRWGSGELYDWSQVSHTTTATTDAEGRFVFPSVAPGDAWVYHRVRLAPGDLRDSNHTHVEVLPGKTAQLQLGGQGTPVIGVVLFPELPIAPDSAPRAYGALWRNPEFSMPRPADWDTMDDEHRRQYEHQWRSTPDGRAWKRSVCNYEIPINADGTFRIEDVRPGRYHMHIRYEIRDKTRDQVRALATADRNLHVPEPQTPGDKTPIDVGDIYPVPK